MYVHDDLSGALLTFALIGLAILGGGCFALAWWGLRHKPSRAEAWAAWTAFLWAYGNLVLAVFIPVGLLAQKILAAVLGIPLVVLAWWAGSSTKR